MTIFFFLLFLLASRNFFFTAILSTLRIPTYLGFPRILTYVRKPRLSRSRCRTRVDRSVRGITTKTPPEIAIVPIFSSYVRGQLILTKFFLYLDLFQISEDSWFWRQIVCWILKILFGNFTGNLFYNFTLDEYLRLFEATIIFYSSRKLEKLRMQIWKVMEKDRSIFFAISKLLRLTDRLVCLDDSRSIRSCLSKRVRF